MNLASDLLDKYNQEQVTAYMDKLAVNILNNYKAAIKVNQPHILFSSLGDIAQLREIIHEMKKRDEAREAMKQA